MVVVDIVPDSDGRTPRIPRRRLVRDETWGAPFSVQKFTNSTVPIGPTRANFTLNVIKS